MKSLKYAGLSLSVLGLSHGAAMAGGHHGWHYKSTTTTTGSPVLLAPAAQPFVFSSGTQATVPTLLAPTIGAAAAPMVFTQLQPFAQAQPLTPAASPTVGYYYYQMQPAASAPAPSAMTAPSMLAPMASAMPFANPSGQATPFAAPVGGGSNEQVRTGRLLQRLREFAANNNIDRATLTTALRTVGLGLLRAELSQFGLGALVPSQTDQGVLEDLVNRVVSEKSQDQGQQVNNGNNGGGGNSPQFVFQGPVTLSFPNVNKVEIQERGSTSQDAAAGAGSGDGQIGSASAPVAPAPLPPSVTTPPSDAPKSN